MQLSNRMEELVREEVARLRAAPPAGPNTCWCALCETDVVALALTLLPAWYCHGAGRSNVDALAHAGKIHDAVRVAAKRVGLRPKHPVGAPGGRREVGLVNFTWEVGAAMLAPSFGRVPESCGCERCRADALAYALNRYPAKYGVALAGRRSLHPTYLEFMKRELGLLIGQAARVVAAQPQH